MIDRYVKEKAKNTIYQAEKSQNFNPEKFGYRCIQMVILMEILSDMKIALSDFLSPAEREVAENIEKIGLEIYKTLD